MDKSDLDSFEKKIGVDFDDKTLLKQVFVHRSYLNENLDFGLDHNERLEFLGDAVLELIVTEYLYQNFDNPEGELTNLRSALVKGAMLSKIAKEIGIENHLYLSKGETKSEGKSRQLIVANAFEALVGALYVDKGYEEAKKFITKHLIKYLANIIENKLYLDPKSHLQELSQEKIGYTPIYKVLSATGPDHAKVFSVGCFVSDEMIGQGTGSSKQNAESEAASDALSKWGKLDLDNLNNKSSKS